jgi:hypothetical protein
LSGALTFARMTETNRRPADRLHDIREQIHDLKQQEAALRQAFIHGELPLDGDEYTVTVDTKISERIDLRAMRKSVAESIWSPFVISTTTNRVTVRKQGDA